MITERRLLRSPPMSTPPVSFLQLLPEPAEREAAELLDGMFSALEPPRDRPHTLVNFVASADGRVTVSGRSGPLGDEGDKAIFHGLRERADAVLAGGATMQTERYGRILGRPERRRRRVERGMSSEPLACLITRSGSVPTEIPLFGEPEARIVVFGPSALRATLDACPAQVDLVAIGPDELTLTTAMQRLRSDYGVATLLCEGGPRLFSSLLQERLVDELFLTVAPMLVGGDGSALTAGPELPEPAKLRLRWLLHRNETLYARYVL